MYNFRDHGAAIWERSGRPARIAIATTAVVVAALLPFAGISILATPVASYDSVLVYPVAIYVLMALGLNIVVGKSGMLDLGYVAFFAIGAYTMGFLGNFAMSADASSLKRYSLADLTFNSSAPGVSECVHRTNLTL